MKTALKPWNLGIVDKEKNILRGSAPACRGNDPEAVLSWLKKNGIRTVLILNKTEQGIDLEEELSLIEDLGLDVRCFNWQALLKEKREAQERQWPGIRSLLRNGASYVHCVWGVDRTGAVIARARRELYGWDAKEACHELRSYGFAFGSTVQELQQYHKEVLDYFGFAWQDYQPLKPGSRDYENCVAKIETSIG